jgi:outer membrane protein TolC
MKLSSLLFILLLTALPCYGASLAELQKNAIDNRKIIEQYQANLDKSSKDVTIARSSFMPNFDVSYTTNSLNESNPQEAIDNSVAYGVITWNLFSGFYDYYNIRSARLLEKAQFYKLQSVKQDIQLNVALRYLEIFNRQTSLEVAEESYTTLKKLHEDAQNRFSVGLIEKNELLRFKVDMNNAAITAKKARAELSKSLQRLVFETDAPIRMVDLDFQEFSQLPVLENQENYQLSMLTKRSDILALEELEKAVALQVKAAYAGRYPRLDVSGSYRKYENDYSTGDGDYYEEELRGKAVLTITLFDGFSQQAEVSKAKSEKRSVAAQLQELKKSLHMELTNLFFDYEVSIDNAAVSQATIEQAKENLRITRLKYKEGLEKESDLLDAITNLSRAKYTYVTARTEVFANYFKITRAVENFNTTPIELSESMASTKQKTFHQ